MDRYSPPSLLHPPFDPPIPIRWVFVETTDSAFGPPCAQSFAGEAVQYFATVGSTSSDQARIPPFRFSSLRKPTPRRNSAASAERLPERQWTTISRELSSSWARREISPRG